LAVGQLHEDPDLAVDDEERLMGVGVRVGGDDVADRTRRGEDAELTIGLIAAQQDREGVSEELRVLALALGEEVGLRLAGQQARSGRSGRVGQILEAHAGLLSDVAM
jgi:hypothetical protein